MIIRTLEALFTINTDTTKFKKATSQLDKFAGHAERVMKTVAGLFAVQALQSFVANTASGMAEVGKSADYLGITADALQELQYAAEKSGVSVDALNDAMKEIQVRASEAKSGQGEAAEAFKMLGLKSTDAAGKIREPLELLDAVADRLKTLPTPSERLWVADAIFGDEGSMVLKMLKDGSAGLHDLRREARALGLTMDTDAIAQATRFNQALNKFMKLAAASGRTIVRTLLPPLTRLIERCTTLSVAFRQMDSKASVVRVTLLSLGIALAVFSAKAVLAGIRMAIAFAPTLLLFGLLAIAIIGIALIIDDLWVHFQGGQSVLSEDIKKCVADFKKLEKGITETWAKITTGINDALTGARESFADFSQWIFNTADALKERMAALFDGLMPDFLKKEIMATVKQISGPAESHGGGNFNFGLAPKAPSVFNQNRVATNQTVNVAVNVKSGAPPEDIGAQVANAFRRELEREHFNAFMGVSQYVG
jgi:hypothetical protein